MKLRTTLLLGTLLSGTLLSSCNSNPPESGKESKEITGFDINAAQAIVQEKTNRFTAAHITKDTAYLNRIFTDDARVLPPNSDIVTGKKAISQLNTDWVNYGIHEFEEVSTSFYGNAEYVIDEGTYRLIYGDDNIVDSGKYINIWKSIDGEWKIYSNIWNTSLAFE